MQSVWLCRNPAGASDIFWLLRNFKKFWFYYSLYLKLIYGRRFLDQAIFMTKERSDNSGYCPQTGPNQFKLVELINSDKKTVLILTSAGSSQVVRIFDRQNFLVFWKLPEIVGVPMGWNGLISDHHIATKAQMWFECMILLWNIIVGLLFLIHIMHQNERLRITAKLRIVFFEDILRRGNSPPVYSNNISLFRVMHSQSHRHSSIEFWTRSNMAIEKLWQWESLN